MDRMGFTFRGYYRLYDGKAVEVYENPQSLAIWHRPFPSDEILHSSFGVVDFESKLTDMEVLALASE